MQGNDAKWTKKDFWSISVDIDRERELDYTGSRGNKATQIEGGALCQKKELSLL